MFRCDFKAIRHQYRHIVDIVCRYQTWLGEMWSFTSAKFSVKPCSSTGMPGMHYVGFYSHYINYPFYHYITMDGCINDMPMIST